MKSKLQSFVTNLGAAFFICVPLCLMGFGFYGVQPLGAFTPTGYSSINATTSSASAVLGSSAASSPAAVMAVVTNLGPNVAYVLFGASNVTATTAASFPIAASSVSSLAIGSARYVAAITPSGTATISVVTGY